VQGCFGAVDDKLAICLVVRGVDDVSVFQSSNLRYWGSRHLTGGSRGQFLLPGVTVPMSLFNDSYIVRSANASSTCGAAAAASSGALVGGFGTLRLDETQTVGCTNRISVGINDRID
jgi:hypothetical protein